MSILSSGHLFKSGSKYIGESSDSLNDRLESNTTSGVMLSLNISPIKI